MEEPAKTQTLSGFVNSRRKIFDSRENLSEGCNHGNKLKTDAKGSGLTLKKKEKETQAHVKPFPGNGGEPVLISADSVPHHADIDDKSKPNRYQDKANHYQKPVVSPNPSGTPKEDPVKEGNDDPGDGDVDPDSSFQAKVKAFENISAKNKKFRLQGRFFPGGGGSSGNKGIPKGRWKAVGFGSKSSNLDPDFKDGEVKRWQSLGTLATEDSDHMVPLAPKACATDTEDACTGEDDDTLSLSGKPGKPHWTAVFSQRLQLIRNRLETKCISDRSRAVQQQLQHKIHCHPTTEKTGVGGSKTPWQPTSVKKDYRPVGTASSSCSKGGIAKQATAIKFAGQRQISSSCLELSEIGQLGIIRMPDQALSHGATAASIDSHPKSGSRHVSGGASEVSDSEESQTYGGRCMLPGMEELQSMISDQENSGENSCQKQTNRSNRWSFWGTLLKKKQVSGSSTSSGSNKREQHESSSLIRMESPTPSLHTLQALQANSGSGVTSTSQSLDVDEKSKMTTPETSPKPKSNTAALNPSSTTQQLDSPPGSNKGSSAPGSSTASSKHKESDSSTVISDEHHSHSGVPPIENSPVYRQSPSINPMATPDDGQTVLKANGKVKPSILAKTSDTNKQQAVAEVHATVTTGNNIAKPDDSNELGSSVASTCGDEAPPEIDEDVTEGGYVTEPDYSVIDDYSLADSFQNDVPGQTKPGTRTTNSLDSNGLEQTNGKETESDGKKSAGKNANSVEEVASDSNTELENGRGTCTTGYDKTVHVVVSPSNGQVVQVK